MKPNLLLSFLQTLVPKVDFTGPFVHQLAEMMGGAVHFCTPATNCTLRVLGGLLPRVSYVGSSEPIRSQGFQHEGRGSRAIVRREAILM
jgi:hypothetical protein